jgi:FKBP-type peptidyl-prolyl cis-trans isomerase
LPKNDSGLTRTLTQFCQQTFDEGARRGERYYPRARKKMEVEDEFVDVSHAKDRGVLKKILVNGAGEPPVEKADVKVHYVGTLLDGTEFDSSRARSMPFETQIGVGQVIKGWDQGAH